MITYRSNRKGEIVRKQYQDYKLKTYSKIITANKTLKLNKLLQLQTILLRVGLLTNPTQRPRLQWVQSILLINESTLYNKVITQLPIFLIIKRPNL